MFKELDMNKNYSRVGLLLAGVLDNSRNLYRISFFYNYAKDEWDEDDWHTKGQMSVVTVHERGIGIST